MAVGLPISAGELAVDGIYTDSAYIVLASSSGASYVTKSGRLIRYVVASSGGSGIGIADWATATAYAVGDYVNSGNYLYKCIAAHTSGVFNTDFAASRWALISSKDQITSPNTQTYVQSSNGLIEFFCDNTSVGQVVITGGIPKWTLSGILDPTVYVGTPQTIAQRNAIPSPANGYLVYVSDGATKEYQWYNGSTWQSIGSGGGGAVSSVFARTGAVVAAAGDYTATQVTNSPAGGIAATNTQAAINELDTDKLDKALSSAQIFVGSAGNVATGVAMSGEASIDNAGSVTLVNSAVTGKVLTGLSVVAGTVVATDSIVSAIGKLQGTVNSLNAAITLQGTWDASTGVFPGAGAAQPGYTYIVSVGGTVDGVTFDIGDRVIALVSNASTTTYSPNWFKEDYTNQVLSVHGRTGAVVAVAGDYSASHITNVPAGNIAATSVQAAIDELDAEKASDTTVVHLAGAETISGVKTFSAQPAGIIGASIGNTPAGNIAATDVQSAINELDVEKAADALVVHLAGAESITGVKTFTAQPSGILASSIVNAPSGGIAAVTVQSAIDELDLEKLNASLTSAMIFVGNGSNVATGVAMSGEASIDNVGAVTLSNAAVIAKVLTGVDIVTPGVVAATDSLLQAVGKLEATKLGRSLTTDQIFVGNASNVATSVPMSGEASIVASGAITLSNAAVIAKVLTGIDTVTTGVVAATDSILAAIGKLEATKLSRSSTPMFVGAYAIGSSLPTVRPDTTALVVSDWALVDHDEPGFVRGYYYWDGSSWVPTVSMIEGIIVGRSTTFAGLPTTRPGGGDLMTGDYAVLRSADGVNAAGLYRWAVASWTLDSAFGGSYSHSFVPANFTAGVLTIPAATHGRGIGLKTVQVYEAGSQVLVETSVNAGTGDVTITVPVGLEFTGVAVIS